MSNWLDKALGRKDSTIQSVPFELNCECGTRLSGLRQERAKRMLCPQCGDSHFVLGLNQYPVASRATTGSGETSASAVTSPAPVRPSTSSRDDKPDLSPLDLPDEADSRDAARRSNIADDSQVDDALLNVNLVDDDDEADFQFKESPEVANGPEFVLGDIPQPPPDRYRSTQSKENLRDTDSAEQTPQTPLEQAPASASAEVDDEIELDLSLGLDVDRPPQNPVDQVDQQRRSPDDSLFDDDAPLLPDIPSQDLSLDVPLLDEPPSLANEHPPLTKPPGQTTPNPSEDIFNDDLRFVDEDDEADVINLDTDTRNIEDVIIEDSDYEPAIELLDDDDEDDEVHAIPLVSTPPPPLPKPRPKAQADLAADDLDADEYDDYDEHLPDDLVGDAFDGSDSDGYDDLDEVEVAEVVDESLLPGAKRMTRGKDRLKDFDHLAEDEVDERSGERPEGTGNRISISGMAKKNRKTRVKVFVVLGLLATVGTLMTIWAVNNSNREQAAIDLKSATEAGLLALDAGDFPTASNELKRAVEAAEILEIETDRSQHVKHLLSESEAAASQSNASLFEIVDRAEMAIKKNGFEDWGHEFDVNYRGRWIIFFGNINSDKEVVLPVMIGNAPVRLRGIEKLIEIASKELDSGAILFAAQLASCGKPQPPSEDEDGKTDTEKSNSDNAKSEDGGDADDFGNGGLASDPDEDPQGDPAAKDDAEEKKQFAPQAVVEDVWEVRFDPATAVLWTRFKSLEQLNFIGSDDDLSKHIRAIVQQQNTAMGFPQDLGIETESVTDSTESTNP